MARLLRLVRQKAVVVASEPEAGRLPPPKEPSIPSVPAGGETPAGQTRRWELSGFWRRPAPPSTAAPTKSKRSWLRRRLGRQDPAQEGRQAGWLLGLLCGKEQPPNPSPKIQQEPSASPVSEDLPSSSEYEGEDSCRSTSSSASSAWDSSSSSGSVSSNVDGHVCLHPGTSEEEDEDEEGQELVPEVAALQTIMEQLRGKEKDEIKKLTFLHAIHLACCAAQQRGQDTLEPLCSKALVVQRVVEHIEEQPPNAAPTATLSGCLIAISYLSTMSPGLEAEQETHVLRTVLRKVLTLDMRMAPLHLQDQYEMTEMLLDAMLGSLLAEFPGTDRLHYILEHVSLWMESLVPQETARAVRCIVALLRLAVSLPGFDNSAEFPQMGHHVVQLALFINHPSEETRHQAQAAIDRLYQILLHQRGVRECDAEDLWCWDWYRDKRRQEYRNMARVGKIFGQFFSEGQRSVFLRSAGLVIHNPLLVISEVGLLLVYGMLGEADQLIGDEVKDMKSKMMHQLYLIQYCQDVPEVLQGVLPTESP